MEQAMLFTERLGYFFYIASPNRTSFETIEEVPNFLHTLFPHLLFLSTLEIIILRFRDNYKIPINDFIASNANGIVYTFISLSTRGIQIYAYNWLYQKRAFTFDWSSPITWWVCAIGTDFGYYCYHRFVHEFNLGWGTHQVHHSSEEYNLSTSVRQPVLYETFSFSFYLPLALLGVPLTQTLVHMQFLMLYQFWIHTEVVSTLGPLEWVFNTPSHHRVHHGSNPWCLDKNYGGVLIIWDRLFGTFAPERKGEQIIYGLVDQPQTFNIVHLQFFHYKNMIKNAMSQDTWANSFRAIFCGPGWTKGSPRLGFPMEDPPKGTPPRKKYNPKVSPLMEAYLVSHFLVCILIQQTSMIHFKSLGWFTILAHLGFLFVTLGNIGSMYDGWSGAMRVEAVRCLAYLVYASQVSVFNYPILDGVVAAYSAVSAVIWTWQSITTAANITKTVEPLHVTNSKKVE